MTEPPGLDVLLVAPALEYSAPTLYALTLAGGLVASGRRVRVLTPGGRLEKSFVEHGIEVDAQPFLERFIVDWFLLRRLVSALRRTGVRIVHAVSSLKVETANAIARRLGVPAVSTVHRYFDPENPVETDWSGVRAIITFSEDLRADAVNERRAPKDLVRVIPSGIAPSEATRVPFDRAGAVPIVGTLGDIEKTEAQADFIRAAAEVLKKAPTVEFLLVSGGAEVRATRALVRELGIGRATTFTTFTDTRRILNLMDVCVLPGIREGPAQTILEAMAAGRPVITTGAGGAYGVIEDEATGLIVPKGEPAALAGAILRVVEDHALARRLGAAAREAVTERFPLARMLEDTLAAYDAAGASVHAA